MGKSLALILNVLLLSCLANAESSKKMAWSPFVGVNGGYSGNGRYLGSQSVPASLKIMASTIVDSRFVLDFGYGIQDLGLTTESNRLGGDTDVFEMATRYELKNSWELGLVYNRFFNRGRNYESDQADALFGGVQVLFGFEIRRQLVGRVGGRIITLLNAKDVPTTMTIVEIQLGWGNFY